MDEIFRDHTVKIQRNKDGTYMLMIDDRFEGNFPTIEDAAYDYRQILREADGNRGDDRI